MVSEESFLYLEDLSKYPNSPSCPRNGSVHVHLPHNFNTGCHVTSNTFDVVIVASTKTCKYVFVVETIGFFSKVIRFVTVLSVMTLTIKQGSI